jgi:hypothetical protein
MKLKREFYDEEILSDLGFQFGIDDDPGPNCEIQFRWVFDLGHLKRG